MTATYRSPDPRYFQLVFQMIFLLYGILWLEWTPDYPHYAASIFGCLLFTFLFESVQRKKFISLGGINTWGLSVSISAMSLCLLLKTESAFLSTGAAFLTVASKYIFRYRHKHIFNPSAFGIVSIILLSNKAWLSPAQWGTGAVLVFTVLVLGLIVVTRVQKLDVSLAFLAGFAGLLFWRQIMVLGWPADYFIHSLSTGSLLLFTFFMISDPRTAPDHPWARIVWALLIAFLSFYFSAFKWLNNTAIWVLVLCGPLVPLLDMAFRGKTFQWSDAHNSSFHSKIKKMIRQPLLKKITAAFLLCILTAQHAFAFCGFYVSKADGTLKNKTSQVILVRDGDKNVITMYNDFKGDFKDFAMVVPVPVLLKKSDIKVVDQGIFQRLNDYSKPRLVEYYDENPCQTTSIKVRGLAGTASEVVVVGYGNAKRSIENRVTIEAKYIVGEYDILILSAKESSGLQSWLSENGYKIPPGAQEVLEPYIKSNLKFFVVKVNEEEKKKLAGDFLRPIQIRFNSPKFMLPIRLGMANADGDQDMIVYAFSKKGRIETTNYRNVNLPTGDKIPLFVKENFSSFYSNLFQRQWQREGKSVSMLEYAWDVSPQNFMKCDPCVAQAPTEQDLVQSGVWWLTRDWNDYSNIDDDDVVSNKVYFTRLHIRYNRESFPQDLMFQVTPNTENYQARYVVTHPASGDFQCDEGKKYLQTLKERRRQELRNLTSLTGKTLTDWDIAMSPEDKFLPSDTAYEANDPGRKNEGSEGKIIFAGISFLALAFMMRTGKRKE